MTKEEGEDEPESRAAQFLTEVREMMFIDLRINARWMHVE